MFAAKKPNQMIKILSLITGITCLSLVSCHNSERSSFFKYADDFELEGVEVPLKDPFMIGQIDLTDDYLVMAPASKDKNQIHIFKSNDFAFLKSAGPVGRGPGEIISPGLSSVDRNEGIVCLFDMGRRSLLGYPIEDILVGNTLTFSEIVPIPKSVFVIAGYSSHPGGLFSFEDASRPEYLISFFNRSGELIDSLAIPDKVDLYKTGEMLPEKRMLQFNFCYSFNQDLSLVAIAYRYSDIVSIIDREGTVITNIAGPDDFHAIPGQSIEEKIAYTDICADEKYIYAVYKNSPRFDVETNSIPQFPSTIHVFTWDGEAVARITTDHSISSITVDNQEDRIITFCHHTGGFVWYDIPEELL